MAKYRNYYAEIVIVGTCAVICHDMTETVPVTYSQSCHDMTETVVYLSVSSNKTNLAIFVLKGQWMGALSNTIIFLLIWIQL